MKETVISIPINELHPFPENPYKVLDNEELQAMTNSIQDGGIISPLIVHPRENGGYEIISGHRRKAACEKAGIDSVPAFVREMDRDTAVIALVDSNLHREHILPSEKAFAYKLKLEALKHQGKACGHEVHKSRDEVSSDLGGRQVQRYIRLTELIDPLLQLVDENKIALSPAVELSYLSVQEQSEVLIAIESEDCTPSHAQAIRMRELSGKGQLDGDTILNIMSEVKPNQVEQYRFKREDLRKYFPKSYTDKQVYEAVFKALELLKIQRERNRDIR